MICSEYERFGYCLKHNYGRGGAAVAKEKIGDGSLSGVAWQGIPSFWEGENVNRNIPMKVFNLSENSTKEHNCRLSVDRGDVV